MICSLFILVHLTAASQDNLSSTKPSVCVQAIFWTTDVLTFTMDDTIVSIIFIFFWSVQKSWSFPQWHTVKQASMDTHQGAAFSHIFQPLQNLRQARVIRVHKPYWRRRWIRFLKTVKHGKNKSVTSTRLTYILACRRVKHRVTK